MRRSLIVLLVAGACGTDAGPVTPPAPVGPPDATYTTRGVVRSFPASEPGLREVVIEHDAIPEFRDRDGRVVGMESMPMRFGIGAAVSTQGVAVGDTVSFTFEVRWSGTPMLMIVALPAPLPPGPGPAPPS